MARPNVETIGFVHPDLGIGGAERLVLDVALAIKDSWDVFFLTNQFNMDYAFDELKKNQFSVYVYGSWLPTNIFGFFHAYCAYFRMLFLAVVYLLTMPKKAPIYFVDSIPLVVPIFQLFGYKVVFYCHHPDLLSSVPGGYLKFIYRKPLDMFEGWCISYADTILVNSQYTASVFKATFPSIHTPLKILYPTVAPAFLDHIAKLPYDDINDLVAEIPSSPEPFVFLSINRFHPAKNLELAINAYEWLNREDSKLMDVYLVLVGGYDKKSEVNRMYYKKLVKMLALKRLNRNIILIRAPTDEMKARLLKSCNCVIYTPVNEHFGIVPLEAMAAEKPVIACNSGGPRETVQDNVSGFLCEPVAEDMARKMLLVMRHDCDKSEMGKRGKQLFENKFNTNKFALTCRTVLSITLHPRN